MHFHILALELAVKASDHEEEETLVWRPDVSGRLQGTEDLYSVLDERRQLLLSLSEGGGGASSLSWPGQPPPPPQQALAAAAADRRLRRVLYLVENALAVLYLHFWRCLPHPQGATAGGFAAGAQTERGLSVFVDRPPANAQQAHDREQLGSDRELDQLRRLLQV